MTTRSQITAGISAEGALTDSLFYHAMIGDGFNTFTLRAAELDANFKMAAQNIPNIDVLPVQGINVYDIIRRNTLVLSKAAVDALEERFK